MASFLSTSGAYKASHLHYFETGSKISRQTEVRDAVLDSMRNWMQQSPQEILGIGIRKGRVVIDVTGSTEPVNVDTLADEISKRLGRDVRITVRWTHRLSQVAWGTFGGEKKAIENPSEIESQDTIKIH